MREKWKLEITSSPWILISNGLRLLPPAPDHCSFVYDCRFFLALLQADLGIFGMLSFGMMGGFTLASWGTLGRFWETGEHNKGNFKVQAWIFIDFEWVLVPTGVIWHVWCLYFTVLGDPGTILGRSWDIREYKKGQCEVQVWILSICGWFRGPI